MFKRLKKQKIEEDLLQPDSDQIEEQESESAVNDGESDTSENSDQEISYQENSQLTPHWLEAFEKYVAEQQIETDDASRLSAKISELIQQLADGGCDEIFALIERGLNYEADLERARTEGEVAGRNARIDELREIEQATDGVPHPGVYPCSAGGLRTPTIFDLAAQA